MSEKILNTSADAATYKTISGWVSRDGRFYGDDERLARWAGCTHLICDCGNEYKKGWTMCQNCRSIKDLERYEARPFKEWDGKEPIYSEALERYFFHDSDLEDYMADEEILPEDLRLVICDPISPRLVEDDWFQDALPEDQYVDDVASKEVIEAMRKLNELLEKEVWSWQPGKFRTNYTQHPPHES